MMFYTQTDVDNYINDVIFFTAQKLGIQTDCKLIDEIKNAIEASHQLEYKMLVYFIASYREWYGFEGKNYSANGHLSSEELQALFALMKKRDDSRNTLIAHLNSQKNSSAKSSDELFAIVQTQEALLAERAKKEESDRQSAMGGSAYN